MFAKKKCKNEGSKDHKIRNFFDQHKLMENEGTVILVYLSSFLSGKHIWFLAKGISMCLHWCTLHVASLLKCVFGKVCDTLARKPITPKNTGWFNYMWYVNSGSILVNTRSLSYKFVTKVNIYFWATEVIACIPCLQMFKIKLIAKFGWTLYLVSIHIGRQMVKGQTGEKVWKLC